MVIFDLVISPKFHNSLRRGAHLRQVIVCKLLSQYCNKLLPNLMLIVILVIIVSLLNTCISSNWADIDHAITILDERASLDGNIQVCDVVQQEFDELFVTVLTELLDEAVRGERYAQLEGCKSILGETEVEERGDGDRGSAELFLLFGEVRTPDISNGYFLAYCMEEGEHIWGDSLNFC